MRLFQMNLLIFFLLAWTKFMKLKWWWGNWSCFFFNCYKVFILMFTRNLCCRNILKYDLYVTNIYLWEPISRYSFIVQASISICPLVHVNSRMCLGMIFYSFKGLFFIIMWFFLIFFKVTWEKVTFDPHNVIIFLFHHQQNLVAPWSPPYLWIVHCSLHSNFHYCSYIHSSSN